MNEETKKAWEQLRNSKDFALIEETMKELKLSEKDVEEAFESFYGEISKGPFIHKPQTGLLTSSNGEYTLGIEVDKSKFADDIDPRFAKFVITMQMVLYNILKTALRRNDKEVISVTSTLLQVLTDFIKTEGVIIIENED